MNDVKTAPGSRDLLVWIGRHAWRADRLDPAARPFGKISGRHLWHVEI